MVKPYYDQDGITIYHADCADVIPLVPPSSVGLLLTDPPYGINHDPTSTVWSVADAVVGDDVVFDPVPLLAFGRCVLWGAENYMSSLPHPGGWIIWDKRNGQDSTESGLKVADCELAWTNVTRRHRIFRELWAGPMRSVGAGPGGKSEGFLHPTQKSTKLMRWIVEQWTEPGDLVFDPYMGSGPVAQACADLGRRYIGVELVETYCAAAVNRLKQLTFDIS